MGIGKPKIISKKKKDPGSIKLTKETPCRGGAGMRMMNDEY